MELQINEAAFSDLKEIKLYFKDCFAEAAFDKLESKIYEEFDKLSLFPEMGATLKKLKSFKHYRFVLVGAYYIFFVPDKNTVRIQRIIHTARDLKKVLKIFC